MDFEDFVFGTPLYTAVKIPENYILKANVTGHLGIKIDGHCSECEKNLHSPDQQGSTISTSTSTLIFDT